jgi:hypothetical protein
VRTQLSASHLGLPTPHSGPCTMPTAPSTWAPLGLASLSLLVLALVVPNGLGGTLAVIGLAALAVFRAAAITGRWLPGRVQKEGGQNYDETRAAPTIAAAG